MQTTTEEIVTPLAKRSSRRTADRALSTCPVDAAGWCSYPFTPSQLERRLRRKMAETQDSSQAAKQPGRRRRLSGS